MLYIDIKKQLFGPLGEIDLKINLDIQEGSFTTLTGKSGSGKTTLLRSLAGLEKASGTIVYNNESWQDSNTFLSPQNRRIGFVFQDYALFENMSIEKNLLFVNNEPKLAQKLLEITELYEMRHRLPTTLSGGQKQRVSLCRAMMLRPKLLLMDEPFSALDLDMRQALQSEVLTLHKEFKTTTIMVSHDPSEIYKLSDRVLVLDHGKIINDGTSKEVFLKTKGSAKFSLEGEIIDILKADILHIAIIAIGQQIVEVVLNSSEASELKIGDKVLTSTKAFSPNITKIS